MRSLLTAHWTFKNYVESGLKQYGLNSGNPKILIYIAEHEGCRQKEIAKNCCVETATLSSVLTKMEDNGLIERKRLEKNKRSYAVYTTEKGMQVFAEAKKRCDEAIEVALAGFTPEEGDKLREYLKRVTENLEKAGGSEA